MIERMRQIIREDRRRTIDEVSMLVGISHGTYHKILTEDLKMRRVAFHRMFNVNVTLARFGASSLMMVEDRNM